MAKRLGSITWWKAKEIPLAEYAWRNVKKYCDDRSDPWEWRNSIYFFRLAPPFTVAYGEDDKKESSPLIYVGSGAIKQRWPDHIRKWLTDLAYLLPGARYELWVFQHQEYEKIERDALHLFRNFYGRLPLVNRVGGNSELYFEYRDEDPIHEVADQDRRYWWALRPIEPTVRKQYFDKGWSQNTNG